MKIQHYAILLAGPIIAAVIVCCVFRCISTNTPEDLKQKNYPPIEIATPHRNKIAIELRKELSDLAEQTVFKMNRDLKGNRITEDEKVELLALREELKDLFPEVWPKEDVTE